MCCRQITLSKTDEICQSAIPKKISTTSVHITSLVKIHWHLLKLLVGKENMDMLRVGNPFKNWLNLPLAIPNQISTVSILTQSLVKTHWHLLKLSSGNKYRWMDIQQLDGQMNGHTDNQGDTIIPHHTIKRDFPYANNKSSGPSCSKCL